MIFFSYLETSLCNLLEAAYHTEFSPVQVYGFHLQAKVHKELASISLEVRFAWKERKTGKRQTMLELTELFSACQI